MSLSRCSDWGSNRLGLAVNMPSHFELRRGVQAFNDTPGVRATFAAFHMIEADTTYTVGAAVAVKAAELIISNFDPR